MSPEPGGTAGAAGRGDGTAGRGVGGAVDAGMLAGVRVVEVSHFLAGPYAGLILADLGADVVKLEDPQRPDEARGLGPHFLNGQSLYFAALNWGKRSLALPAAPEDRRQVTRDLLASADVLLTNFRPRALARLGLDRASVEHHHPHLVSCSLTGFGETGPYADRPGYDYTIQAASGAMGLAGEPGGPPVKAGISYVDHSGGLAAALAVTAGLLSRTRTGKGVHIDLGLFDIQMSMLTYLAAWSLNAGFEPVPVADSAHPSLVPAQNFPTATGWLTLFVGNDSMWSRLVEVLGDEELGDPAYRTAAGRATERCRLLERLRQILRSAPAAEWADRLSAAGVACAPVATVSDALGDAQTVARDLVVESDHPRYGCYRHVPGPFPTHSVAARTPAPLMGEHSAEVLAELGYGADRILALATPEPGGERAGRTPDQPGSDSVSLRRSSTSASTGDPVG